MPTLPISCDRGRSEKPGASENPRASALSRRNDRAIAPVPSATHVFRRAVLTACLTTSKRHVQACLGPYSVASGGDRRAICRIAVFVLASTLARVHTVIASLASCQQCQPRFLFDVVPSQPTLCLASPRLLLLLAIPCDEK